MKAIKNDVRALKGSLKKYVSRTVTIEKMDQTIRRRVKRPTEPTSGRPSSSSGRRR